MSGFLLNAFWGHACPGHFSALLCQTLWELAEVNMPLALPSGRSPFGGKERPWNSETCCRGLQERLCRGRGF